MHAFNRTIGIDAPERSQRCEDAAGKAYRCGQVAALALNEKIDTAMVFCERRKSALTKEADDAGEPVHRGAGHRDPAGAGDGEQAWRRCAAVMA